MRFSTDVLKRNLRVAQGKERQMQLRGGIRISRKNDKYMRAIVRYIEKYEGELRREALYEKIAKLIGKSAEEVQRLIAMNNSAVCVEETYVNDEGETESIFDNMSDSEEITEDKLIQTEKFHKLIEELNEMFLTVQDRSRRLLSMLITSKIISEFDDDYEKILPIIRKKSFFNAELFERYLQDGKVLTARQIASLCGVTEQSASRTLRNFLQKRDNDEE